MLILPFKAIHSELLKTSLKDNKSILILIPPHLKEEALDRTMWRARFGRGFGPRDSVRSTRGLGPTMTARGQSIGISIDMLPQTLIMSITVQKTSKYYTTEIDLEEGF